MTRIAGFSGTVFRLQGGSLVEGEDAPFDKVVFRYPLTRGIDDGYLVPAFSAKTLDNLDRSKLKVRQGEYTSDSQDAQMLEAIDNHILQMMEIGRERRAWLVFEASTKSAKAMVKRLNEWGIPSGLVLGETPAGERTATIAAYRAGRLRCLVNVAALTTGFDVQEVDMLVMRRATKSLGLFVQMTGRLLRTIGGNIQASIAAGKPDGLVVDFAGNCVTHGPLDLLRPRATPCSLVSCDHCGKRNAGAAARCWSCDEPMTKLCPACLEPVEKGVMDCPTCGHDMRAGPREESKGPKLLDAPSGAALISSYRPTPERAGGWQPVRKVWSMGEGHTVLTAAGEYPLSGKLAHLASSIRWIRAEDGAVLVPNGASRNSVRMHASDGSMLIVPMPSAL